MYLSILYPVQISGNLVNAKSQIKYIWCKSILNLSPISNEHWNSGCFTQSSQTHVLIRVDRGHDFRLLGPHTPQALERTLGWLGCLRDLDDFITWQEREQNLFYRLIFLFLLISVFCRYSFNKLIKSLGITTGGLGSFSPSTGRAVGSQPRALRANVLGGQIC